MSYNENWIRWVRSSFDKYVDAHKGIYSIFYEGQAKKINELTQWMEFRIGDIDQTENSKDFWRLAFSVEILCITKVTKDLYNIDRMTGWATKILGASIPIYQEDDDPTIQIGCLTWRSVFSGTPEITAPAKNYGQVDTTVKLIQATVASKYDIEFP